MDNFKKINRLLVRSMCNRCGGKKDFQMAIVSKYTCMVGIHNKLLA